jgi:Uma2 family endonuclease
MKAAALVPVEEYLRTTYHPDCDYVDGEVLERNVGERDHSETQRELIGFFWLRKKTWKTFAFPEQRVQVSPRRFRIPDVCVFVGRRPKDQIFHEPPFICIEVMSPEDRIERMQSKIDDYLNFGVAYVWVINPRTRRAWVYTKDGITEAKDGVLRTENPHLEVPLAEIFAGIDEN